jgi:hypothetical protein
MFPTTAREVAKHESIKPDIRQKHVEEPESITNDAAREVELLLPGVISGDKVEALGKLLRKTSLSIPSPIPATPEQERNARFQFLLPPSWQRLVLDWFHEDIPVFDYGGFVVGETEQVATLYGKNKVFGSKRSNKEGCIGRGSLFRRSV